MVELNTLIAFLIASAGLILLPGPDNLLVLSLSALHGAKTGIATALGMAAGNFIHTLAVALGFSAVLSQAPIALTIIKSMGVVYLLYLAWQSWQHPISLKQSGQPSPEGNQLPFALFKRGVLMNVLNPKVALFFVAFFPQFVNHASAHPSLQIFLLGTIFVLLTALIFSAIALAAGTLQTYVSRINPRRTATITSGLFILLAGLLALHNFSA